MAMLDINGTRVEIDDGFLSLSPEEQNAAVDEIGASLGLLQRPAANPTQTALGSDADVQQGPPPAPGPQFGPPPAPMGPQQGPPPAQDPMLQAQRLSVPAGEAERIGQPLPAPPPESTSPNRWFGGAEAVFNDIEAGRQQINPVAAQEAVGQAVGELITPPGGGEGYISEFDGRPYVPLSEYPSDQFVTVQEGGRTLVLPRAATDSAGKPIEAGRLESAGRLIGYAVPTGVPSAGRAVPAPKPAQQALDDATAVGVRPSFAMQGPAAGKVAAAGEQFAPTAAPFQRDAERVTGEIAKAADRLADAAGPGITPETAGEALQRGSEVYVKGVREFQGELYKAVDKVMPGQTPIGTPETVDFIRRELGKLESAPNIAKTLKQDKLAGWLSDLEGAAPSGAAGGLTFEQARALRTSIGETLRSGDLVDRDVATGTLKAIYGRLSKDLDAAATAQGPEAAWMWNRANKYTKTSEDRIKTAFGRILKADHPEQAYATLTGMAAEGGGKANIGALRRVFSSLPADERAIVAGTIIRRLGRATPGAQNAAGDAFSASTFLTNWNRMAPEAREIIGRSGLDEGVGEGLTTLARVMERFNAAEAMRNRSNTGNVGSAVALTTGFMYAPASTIATVVGSRIGAEVLTSRPFLHAVNRFAATNKTDALMKLAKSAGTPGAIEAQTILRLSGQEASSPQTQSTRAAQGSAR